MELDYNNSETWVTSEIHNAPMSPEPIEAYQKKIDAICGFTPNGKSCVRLVWMPSMENYHPYYCEWDKAGFGTKTHLRAVYVYETLYDKDDNPVDVPVPRWALQQWLSGTQYNASEELVRWEKAEGHTTMELTEQGFVQVSHQTASREIRPPHPSEGRYIPLRRMGFHNDFCCKKAKKTGGVCYGRYREPDESYLEELRLAVQMREEETNGQNPNEPISQETIRQAAGEADRVRQEKEERSRELVGDYVDANSSRIAPVFTGDKFRKAEYSFSNYERTTGGILMPK